MNSLGSWRRMISEHSAISRICAAMIPHNPDQVSNETTCLIEWEDQSHVLMYSKHSCPCITCTQVNCHAHPQQ